MNDSGTMKFELPSDQQSEKKQESKALTFEEAKELIAKKRGFDSWEHVQTAWLDRTGRILIVHEVYLEDLFQLLTKSKSL
jgi:hypothetical protein